MRHLRSRSEVVPKSTAAIFNPDRITRPENVCQLAFPPPFLARPESPEFPFSATLFAPPLPTDTETEAAEGGRKSTVNETIEYLMHCAKNSLTIQHGMPFKSGKQASKGGCDISCLRGHSFCAEHAGIWPRIFDMASEMNCHKYHKTKMQKQKCQRRDFRESICARYRKIVGGRGRRRPNKRSAEQQQR